ncbi:transporter [Falsirhodobacter sp. alg1]|uniref:SphA family protein n=1 Tax=Falsirhodobacter sp. alg1 TaxID=1472418 RepID=UPI0006947526|nr:transporter [Falsirhodobacter sp. alg1]
MMLRNSTYAGVLAASVSVLVPGIAFGAEGASSHYLPGTAGDLGFALPPAAGFQFANILWSQSGAAQKAVVQGNVNLDLDVNVTLDILALTYTLANPVWGATYTFGASLPFGSASLDADILGPNGGRFGASQSSFALSDAAITPIQLNWATGRWAFELSQAVIVASGEYDVDDKVNLGRNYTSFDTAGAVTWLDPATALEVSVAAGLMINTENNDTDYRTGNEFHMDFAVNHMVLPTFSYGVRGYYYDQVSADSGEGATLGDFKSSALGLGAGFVWLPAAASSKLSIAGRYMTDIEATNRFESDYAQLLVGWKF